jgi:DNA-binding CsgD family transcriptional regulator
MDAIAELSQLLIELYRAAREMPLAEFQGWALGLLRPALGFNSAQWGSGTQKGESISKHGFSLFLVNEPPDAADRYDEVKDQDLSVRQVWKQGQGVIAFNAGALFAAKSHAGIRAYTRRVAHENTLIAFDVDRTRGFTRWLSLYRADAGREYQPEDRRLLGLVFPHLCEALAINRATHLARGPIAGAAPSFALAIVERDGYLCHAEDDFAALLRDEFGDRWRSRLPDRCVAALLDTGRFVGRSIAIEVAARADVLFLRGRPSTRTDRLTRREHQIAEGIARGLNHKEVARALGIAPATVRNTLQTIYRKLDVHNAVELSTHVGRLR